jgi:hypothetical protein
VGVLMFEFLAYVVAIGAAVAFAYVVTAYV